MKKLLLPVFLCLALAFPLRAQLFVDTMQYTPLELVTDFFGNSCVEVLSVDYQGFPMQITFFEGSQSSIGVNAGLLLTSGDPQKAIGPNMFNSAGAGLGGANPDPLLSPLVQSPIYDKAVLHMQVRPSNDTLTFKYVFGSEEYCEYVGSQFNDVFGFFIAGPGYPNPTNISMVPGTNLPVAINNVNHTLNQAYYINNISNSFDLCGQMPSTAPTQGTIEYDGLTTVLTAQAFVQPDTVYDVWIGVTDAGDGIFDSGVFLSSESLCGNKNLVPQAGFYEEYVDEYTVQFHNKSKYATAWHWKFGDGATSEARNPSHTYTTLEKMYTVELITENYCCKDTSTLRVGSPGPKPIKPKELVKVYPTTFSDQLVVEPSASLLPCLLRITDFSGNPVMEQSIAGPVTLETGSLPNGIYFVQMIANDRTVQVSRKVVK